MVGTLNNTVDAKRIITQSVYDIRGCYSTLRGGKSSVRPTL